MSQFSPFKSFVDLTFFSKLSQHKLDNAKLSEESVAIEGFAEIPLQVNRPAAIRFTADSFDPIGEPYNTSNGVYSTTRIPGHITNLNTIDAFKELDKAKFIRTEAQRLAKLIESREILSRPIELLKFHVITFADLKKYKYYSWFAFPSFSWHSQAEWLDDKADPKLNATMGSLVTQAEYDCTFVRLAETADGEYKPLPLTVVRSGPEDGESGRPPAFAMVDYGSQDGLPWQLRNFSALLANLGFEQARIYIFRDHPRLGPNSSESRWVLVNLKDSITDINGIVGWERNAQNKLAPKITDLTSLSDPLELASQAVDLNLKLMKWRAAPDIDLEIVKNQKVLLLGAGTLGSYVARGLLAWGVRQITFVDNGTVSYSNPVRQPLYTLEDSKHHGPKAEVAAKALRDIFPSVKAAGYNLSIPMAGHRITDEERQRQEYEKLLELIDTHDSIFLLMDSRESRWLPTVIAQAKEKLAINVAIGFDSFLALRHGVASQQDHSSDSLGCYFCNDVVAPIDSISRLTLDQMCTVTRPGVAQLASGYAIELFATVLQHPQGVRAPANAPTALGPATHQLRGFLNRREIVPIHGQAFKSCAGCGSPVVESWKNDGWDFVKRALNDPQYITEISGLADLQRETEELDLADSDEEFS